MADNKKSSSKNKVKPSEQSPEKKTALPSKKSLKKNHVVGHDKLTQEEKNAVGLWKKMSSGCQCGSIYGTTNLCWMMASMNAVNFFGSMDKHKKKPIQGVDNAISYYLKSGGDRLKLDDNMWGRGTISKYLNKNKIKTCTIVNGGSFDYFDTKKESEENLVRIIKKQFESHFKADKNRPNKESPVLSFGHNHWISVVKYFEDTGNVVVVDSLNGFRKDSKIYVKNIEDLIKEDLLTERKMNWEDHIKDKKDKGKKDKSKGKDKKDKDKNKNKFKKKVEPDSWTTDLIFTSKDVPVDQSNIEYVSSAYGFAAQNSVKNMIAKCF